MSLDIYLEVVRPVPVFSINITHNLGPMAKEAGIYEYMWHPEEVGVKVAADLIAPLAEGLARLTSDPERFKRLNPENGWGTYEGLIGVVKEYLAACREDPEAMVRVSR